MKKRKFLSPVAISVAALLSGPAAAITTQDNNTSLDRIKLQAIEANALGDLVLEPSGTETTDFAYHRSHQSHRSHSSHQSHRSHYSSAF